MRRLWLLLLPFVFTGILFAQAPSAKQEVALFGTSGLQIPPTALAAIDARIREVFAGSDRFVVVGLPYRMSEADIPSFIAAIKRLKSPEGVIPETIDIGKEPFPAAALQRIAKAAFAAIPDVTDYLHGFSEVGGYNARIETGFTLVDIEKLTTLAHFVVNTLGTGTSPQDAIREAADQIPIQLAFELRAIPGFHFEPGLVRIDKNTALIQFGRKMGVHVGDRYAIVSTRLSPSGSPEQRETGLLLVSKVHEDYSYARVISAKPGSHVGDQLREIPQIGFASNAYLHIVANSNTSVGALTPPIIYGVGTYESITRGFYNFRPLIGVETAIASAFYAAGGVPLNLYLGAELNWRFGRFDLRPMAACGIGGMMPLQSGASFYMATAGGFGQVSLSYLVGRSLHLSVDAGYVQWLPLVPNAGFGGFYGGIGIGMDL